MIDILKSLQNKPDPLRKKGNIPASVPLAEANGATPNQAQMAPTPQFQQAQLKRLGQQAQRTAQVKAEAPRELGGEEQSSLDRAQQSITAKAAFDQANFEAAQNWQAEQTSAVPVQGLEGDLASGIASGSITEAGIEQTADQAIGDFLTGSGFEDSLTMTIGELQDYSKTEEGAGQFDEIIDYATNTLGLGPYASLSDIKQAVDTEVQQATEIVDNQRDILNDPNATPMERQAAMRNMKDYGAAHLIATDAELDNFANDISKIGVMEINGEQVTLEDLQDNEAVMAMITTAAEDYLDDGSSIPEWANDYPDLWNTVEKNASAIFSSMSDDLANFRTVKKTLDDNKEITSKLGPQLTQSLGLNIPSSESVTEKFPGLESIKDPNVVLAKTGLQMPDVLENINYLGEIAPNLIQEWAEGKTELSSVLEKADDYKSVQAIYKNPNALKRVVGVNTSRLSRLLADAAQFPEKYSPSDLQMLKVFDPGGTGVVDQNSLQRLSAFALEGKEFPDLRDIETVGERQATAIHDIVSKVGDIQMDTYTGKAKSLGKINKAIGDLKRLDAENPMVKAQLEDLQKLKNKIVRTTGLVADEPKIETVEPLAVRSGTSWESKADYDKRVSKGRVKPKKQKAKKQDTDLSQPPDYSDLIYR